ncbi:Do family serine endopeptidase [Campylobacter sp. MG1]|uniref:Do family serine endopeptidase n=1 Tax=Campylobacter sp. MG1 TaxID=2976332 RepID=UPI00226CA64D|nr:Do family serine endopeptidase [Campylobacter sp. MG1]
MKKVIISLLCVGFLNALELGATSKNVLNLNIAPSAQRENPNDINYILSYNNSINESRKSVVNILVESKSKNLFYDEMNGIFNDPFFKNFFDFINPKDGDDFLDKRLGSGVIISSDGYIITNSHVVQDSEKIIVNIDDNEYNATLIGSDNKTDIAIIKIDAKELNAIKFANSDEVLVGDIVFAIGNPFGVGETITSGIVSALNKNNIGLNTYENFIQTDAAINPGNSGGALVDSRGALIGINSAIITRSGGANGIGFAIPSNMVKNIATQLIEKGKIERGYLGVYLTELKGDLKKAYNNQTGVLITQVEVDSVADKAGLKRGDLITKIDNMEVKNVADLKNYIGALSPNTKVSISYERDGKMSSVEVSLSSDKISLNDEEFLGLILSDLTKEQAKKYNNEGVLVKSVSKKSKSYEAGIKEGDLIVAVENIETKNISQLKNVLSKFKNKQYLKIWIERNSLTNLVIVK